MKLQPHSTSCLSGLVLALSLGFTGCGVSPVGSPVAAQDTATTLHGSVHGGQQPVAGSTIRMYTLGTGGDGAAATSLLTAPVTTGSDGSFSLSPGGTPLYSCTGATQVFLTATGGNPGLGANNPNLALMAALGPCSGLSTSTYISVNELTTVAAVAAMTNYMTSASNVASYSYDAGALQAQAVLATELVSPATGTAPGAGVPAGEAVPATLINTLGNTMAACINSAGGTAGDGTACGTLFDNARNSYGTAPTDTVTAMLNIANHPTANTATLVNLGGTTAPFQPSMSTAPASLQVKLTPAFTPTYKLVTFPNDGFTSIYALVNNAQSTVDMTMYELVDTTMSGDLVAACKRGVTVRVILDTNGERTSNTPAYNQINAQPNCSAVWANSSFSVTHQKSLILDGSQLALMTANLASRYYSQDRDFAVIYNDPVDVAAVQATFNSDYAAGGSSTAPTFNPPLGNDLIWSPTSARSSLTSLLNNAESTLWLENEELSDSGIISAITAACNRKVQVYITMTDSGSYHTTYHNLAAAGCNIHLFPDSTKYTYVHAKVILADYGTAAQAGYVGSINFSTNSLTKNRELGMYVNDSGIMQGLYNALSTDYAGAPASTY